MAEEKTERTVTEETTVKTGGSGTSSHTHAERTETGPDGKTKKTEHDSDADKNGDEVDASMPPGGTYS